MRFIAYIFLFINTPGARSTRIFENPFDFSSALRGCRMITNF